MPISKNTKERLEHGEIKRIDQVFLSKETYNKLFMIAVERAMDTNSTNVSIAPLVSKIVEDFFEKQVFKKPAKKAKPKVPSRRGR